MKHNARNAAARRMAGRWLSPPLSRREPRRRPSVSRAASASRCIEERGPPAGEQGCPTQRPPSHDEPKAGFLSRRRQNPMAPHERQGREKEDMVTPESQGRRLLLSATGTRGFPAGLIKTHSQSDTPHCPTRVSKPWRIKGSRCLHRQAGKTKALQNKPVNHSQVLICFSGQRQTANSRPTQNKKRLN